MRKIEKNIATRLLSIAAPTALEKTMSAAAMASIPAIPAAAPGPPPPPPPPPSSSIGTLTHLVSTSSQKWKRAEQPAKYTLLPERDSRTGRENHVLKMSYLSCLPYVFVDLKNKMERDLSLGVSWTYGIFCRS